MDSFLCFYHASFTKFRIDILSKKVSQISMEMCIFSAVTPVVLLLIWDKRIEEALAMAQEVGGSIPASASLHVYMHRHRKRFLHKYVRKSKCINCVLHNYIQFTDSKLHCALV